MISALLRGRRAHHFFGPSGRRWASAALAACALAACGGDPSGPGGGGTDTSSDVPLSADFELQVAADETVAEATIEDLALWVAADPATGPWAEAREWFRRARQAWRSGDAERAAELALEGRLVLATALVERRGAEGLDALESHVEIVLERLDEASEEYARAASLRERLAGLLAEARERRAAGDEVAAAERLILALGIADRMRHRYDDGRFDPETFATRAVAAAERVLARVDEAVGRDGGPRVRHALGHAHELGRRANAALDRGAWRRAVVLARRSIGWSLHALRLYLA